MNWTVKPFLLFCIPLIMTIGCSKAPWEGAVTAPGQYTIELEHDSVERTYDLHVPIGYDGNTSVPLVFDLHPVIVNGQILELMSNFQSLSDTHGFILVQPNGTGNSWNAGPVCCSPAYKNDVDDIGFIRAIRDDLLERGLDIDISKVFADGMSNGAYLAHTIACEDSELLAGIAPVVAGMGYHDVNECTPSKPMPVLMISGAKDGLSSKEETFNRWVELNSCTTSQSETFGVFTCTTYDDCDAGVETTHCVGEGVGHCWPGTDFVVYGCNQDLDASQVIWEFYERIINE
ncbi:MAG: hypothetical protein COA99_07405 [Moraxellaceae bacterium]|nr:MAG: hypothetical protein COA99_07405 [Moraxellaceae bacterium]